MQCELDDPELGTLELGTDPYIVTALDIGSPAVREVVRNRSLGDGGLDDTRFLGSRAITMSIRFNDVRRCESGDDMQTLIDRLTPYMHPRRRPTLSWRLPGSSQTRCAIVRGVDWPFSLNGPKGQTIAAQWVAPSGEILAGGPDARRTVRISPSSDVEAGRTYPLRFDRTYPPSSPIGSRSVENPGTTLAHWTATIFGPARFPELIVNGRSISFDRRGGVELLVGQTLVIDTRSRTMLFNGVRGQSAYQFSNFDEWSWDDLLLLPRRNSVRFGGEELTAQSAVELTFVPTYL